jgi:hypothetical protein
MTLPLFLALHLVYGAAMAHAMRARLLADGDLIGIPLFATLVPVALFSAPVGAVLLRYAGGWFLHGALMGDGSVVYERFHLGLMVGIGLGAALCTVAAMAFSIAYLSRRQERLAQAPYVLAVEILVVTLALDFQGVFHVVGSARGVWAHPVGLFSLALVMVLGASWRFASARLSVAPRPTVGLAPTGALPHLHRVPMPQKLAA